ncbi:MAG: hypothetical protein KDC67_04545, partial [Ignavibacteriae bacterium]|nr:hypothetical protein [Ignavibacteriota bacterium]
MKYILLILSIFLFSCSSHVEKNIEPVTQIKKVSERDREFARQLFIDASMMDLENKFAEAILDYQEALRLDPSAGIYYALGKDFLRLSKLSQALANTKMAVELEPTNVEYLTLLGTIYSFSRNVDSAEVVFGKIVNLDSTDVNARFNLAQLNEAKSPLKSLELYKEILSITGPEWNVLLKMA